MDLGLMWDISETFNGLMAIPNLIAVGLLVPTTRKLVKDYFKTENPNSYKSTVSKWLSGNSMPNETVLISLANFFNVSSILY